jgi:hypothetical protein
MGSSCSCSSLCEHMYNNEPKQVTSNSFMLTMYHRKLLSLLPMAIHKTQAILKLNKKKVRERVAKCYVLTSAMICFSPT